LANIGALEPSVQTGIERVSVNSSTDLEALYARIGYQFENGRLAQLALSHRSVVSEQTGLSSNERLEFLGDRVLGLVAARMLYRTYPQADEGELHRRHRALVRKDTCAAIAREIGLGAFLILGKSEVRSGGRTKQAILADACEAMIAAIYLDGGMECAEAFVEQHWRNRMEEAEKPKRDGKSALQEWVQGKGFPPPVYEETARSGPDHKPVFTVRVVIEGLEPAYGKGHTKRDAEQDAAEAFLVAGGLWDGNGVRDG